ncbi:MAG: transporter [Micavibrio sp.]|mgnify:CR=1 FL=1|nr:transporter [Micavibrio sp.]
MGSLSSSLTSLASTAAQTVLPAAANALVDTQLRRIELRGSQDLALKQLQQKQALDMQSAQNDADLDRQKIALDAQMAEKERQAALKRATARQRALLGSKGVGGNGGSGEAILLGLFDESDAERQERETMDTLRQSAIDQDLSSLQQRNLLEVSQLRDRQRLENSIFG